MKVFELIEKLKQMPQDAPVVLCDSNRMAYEASGEPSLEGLYYDFGIEYDEEMFFSMDDEDECEAKPIPTIVLSFETDYEEKMEELKSLDSDLKDIEDNK